MPETFLPVEVSLIYLFFLMRLVMPIHSIPLLREGLVHCRKDFICARVRYINTASAFHALALWPV